jgi:hypothetical protein
VAIVALDFPTLLATEALLYSPASNMDSKTDPESAQQATIETVEDPSKHNGFNGEHHAGKDRAAELLGNSNERVVISEVDNKRILHRIDLAILPVMLGVYFLQQLDKSTLSYASVFGLITDAHLGGQDYSWLGSIVYIAQLVMQPVIAYFLVKLPTGKFAASMVLCWGIVLSCMAVAKNFKGLLATRFFLGCFEASVGMCLQALLLPLSDIPHSPNVHCHYTNVVET